MSIRVAAGVIDTDAQVPSGATVTLNEEAFQNSISIGTWSTPGANLGEGSWSQGTGATPTGSTGPAGGSDPTTRAVTASNGYAYVEATNTSDDIWTLESPEFDSSAGTLTLTFDVHMRFGAEGGIVDGVLTVEGWDGTDWATVGSTITGSQQTSASQAWVASTTFGTYDSSSFSNEDFRFRFRFNRGGSQFFSNYDCAVDNLTIIGPEDAAIVAVAPDVLETALKLVYVDATNGNNANDGLTDSTPKRTINAGITVSRPGDIVLVKPGTYREVVNINNKGTSASLPLYLLAETRGTVVISDMWPQAEAGTAVWQDEGGGYYSSPHSARPYIGSYVNDAGDEKMLMQYNTQSDLRAASLSITTAQGTSTHSKPRYGFAHDNGRVFLRIDTAAGAAVDPNGEEIKLTDNFSRSLMSIISSPYVIVDGFIFEGAGNDDAITTNAASSHLTVRNCIFRYSRRCAQVQNDFLAEWNEYTFPGYKNWSDDAIALNAEGNGVVFALLKGHFTSGGNAFLEGGFCERVLANTPAERAEFAYNWVHGVFEGHRLGAFNNSRIHHERAEFVGDNWIEFEHFRESSPCRNLSVHDCRCSSSHDAPLSHQDSTGNRTMRGPHYIYRCVVDNPASTGDYAHPFAIIKNRRMNTAVRIFYYHNYLQNRDGINNGFGGVNYLYWDATDAEQNPELIRLYNNILASENGPFTTGNGGNPTVRGNALFNPTDITKWTNNGGAFVDSDTDSLDLNSFFVPQTGSPVLGIGGNLDAELVDSRTGAGANDDAGPFKEGDSIDADWPRPNSSTFTTDLPARWTSPGSS